MDLKGMDNKVNGLSKTFHAVNSSENSVKENVTVNLVSFAFQ